MRSIVRRARGRALRLVRNRPVASVTGGLLLALAFILLAGDYAWETWITDGLGLVMGATGVALVVGSFGGRRPDWIDPDANRGGTAA